VPDDERPSELQRWIRKHRFGVLLASILMMALLPVLRGAPTDESASLLWAFVLIAGVHAAAGRARLTVALSVIAVFGFSGRLAGVFGPRFQYQDQLDVGGYVLSAAFLAVVIYVVFSEVVRSTHVDADTVMGAMCVYLLIGFMWTNLYAIVYTIEPAAFRFPENWQVDQGLVAPEFTFGYYSFVTLTTLGFGDVIPITYRARTLSWLEAVFGVTYLAVVVASLVGQIIAARQESREY